MTTRLPPWFEPGSRAQIGEHTFGGDEIIRFARAFDPQPFHTDREKAKASVFGGLCASGWHTASVWMRKQREHAAATQARLSAQGYGRVEFGPSPGFSNLKWLRPVFEGDTVYYFNETANCRPSASKPGWYVLTGLQGGDNQHGDAVIRFESSVLLRYPA